MSVIKSIELIGSSPDGWEDAVKSAIDEAKKTIRNIRRVTVSDLEVLVEDDKITSYQSKVKLYFTIEREKI
ncbi:MAG: hypothetical protein GWP10_06695 [Nitrospiraceae bacterium]|nr:hypothetical protein [Nitrospiraceae bacterium]